MRTSGPPATLLLIRRIRIDYQKLTGTPENTVGAVPLKWFERTPPLLRP